jgi:hypothetical protein
MRITRGRPMETATIDAIKVTIIASTELFILSVVALVVVTYARDCRRNRAIVEQLASSVTGGREMRSSALGSRHE